MHGDAYPEVTMGWAFVQVLGSAVWHFMYTACTCNPYPVSNRQGTWLKCNLDNMRLSDTNCAVVHGDAYPEVTMGWTLVQVLGSGVWHFMCIAYCNPYPVSNRQGTWLKCNLDNMRLSDTNCAVVHGDAYPEVTMGWTLVQVLGSGVWHFMYTACNPHASE